jgi:hypothetical protein
MTSPANYEQLARRLRPSPEGVAPITIAAYLLEWNPVTRESVVTTGAQQFVNLPMISPSLLSIGPVTLLNSPGRPLILGRVFEADPTLEGP